VVLNDLGITDEALKRVVGEKGGNGRYITTGTLRKPMMVLLFLEFPFFLGGVVQKMTMKTEPQKSTTAIAMTAIDFQI